MNLFRLFKPIYFGFSSLCLSPSHSRHIVNVVWNRNNDEMKKNYNLQTSDDLVSLLFNRWLNRFELAAFACYTFHLNFFPLCSSFKYDFDKSKIAGSTHTLTTQPLVIDSEHFFGILLHKRN